MIGTFNTTSLNAIRITVNGGSGNDTVDISGLTSAHRLVFTSGGGTDQVVGNLRPQDVIDNQGGGSVNRAGPEGSAHVTRWFAEDGLSEDGGRVQLGIPGTKPRTTCSAKELGAGNPPAQLGAGMPPPRRHLFDYVREYRMRLFWMPVPPALTEAVRACRTHFTLAAIYSALINILYLAPTIYMMQVYDRVVPTNGVLTLVFITVVVGVAIATLSALDAMRVRLMTRASLRLNRILAGEILDRLLARIPCTARRSVDTAGDARVRYLAPGAGRSPPRPPCSMCPGRRCICSSPSSFIPSWVCWCSARALSWSCLRSPTNGAARPNRTGASGERRRI